MGGKRHYDASGRRAAAAQRRLDVAAVAAVMFAERGWSATRVSDVAAAAGVSTELVTKAFGTKAGLFMAAFRRLGFGDHADLQEALGSLDLAAEPDPTARLQRFVAFAADAQARLAPLLSVLAIGADQDVQLRALVDDARARHAGSSAEVTALLADGPVRDGAVDEVYVITLAETWASFRERGWDDARYATWLHDALRHALRPPG